MDTNISFWEATVIAGAARRHVKDRPAWNSRKQCCAVDTREAQGNCRACQEPSAAPYLLMIKDLATSIWGSASEKTPLASRPLSLLVEVQEDVAPFRSYKNGD